MNLYKRAAEIFRKNGVRIPMLTEDDEETLKENEGVEFWPAYMYDGEEIVQTLQQQEE